MKNLKNSHIAGVTGLLLLIAFPHEQPWMAGTS